MHKISQLGKPKWWPI